MILSFLYCIVGHLNWWADIGICQRLVPLATVGDGNCLLHAASLGMWGFHDRLLTLRKALNRKLADDPESAAIKRRWKLQQYQKNMEAGGLVYTEEEWEKEWEEVLRLASTNRRKLYSSESKSCLNKEIPTIPEGQAQENKDGNQNNKEANENESKNSNCSAVNETSSEKPSSVNENESKPKQIEKEKKEEDKDKELEGAFESLEDIHVFVLAHVLRRPIIIIADKFLRDFSGDPIAPIPFGGIYLPFECPPQTCHKTPLILVFESAHFSAAVVIEDKSKQSKPIVAIPVVDRDLTMLPLHFSVDPGEKFDWSSLNEETQLPSKMMLNSEKQYNLLEKYLNIAHIRTSNAAKRETQQLKKDGYQAVEKPSGEGDKKGKKEVSKNGESKEVSWFENSINKVGNFAGMIKKLVDTSTICVAKIQTNEKPDYYDEMINNYIDSAKKRFEEKKQKQLQNNQGRGKQQPCISPGCPMYGRADTSYLCSGCYKTQKSASESAIYKAGSTASTSGNSDNSSSSLRSFLPPVSLSSYVPYDYFTSTSTGQTVSPPPPPTVQPPSYSEACKSKMPNTTMPKCRKEGCGFYGSPEKQGYCSSCFKKEMPSNHSS